MAKFTREDFKKFDRLYRVDKSRGMIFLKPRVDTREPEDDALLLIIYGYTMLKGKLDVSVHVASRSLWESGYRWKQKSHPTFNRNFVGR
jgi:hypothetical protein